MSSTMKRLNFLMSEIESAYHEIARKMGLSDSACTILYSVCERGDSCPLSDIMKYTGISKQTINSALRKLESEGVVYLENQKGKKKNVCLTEHGKELSDNTVRKLLQMENDIFNEWPQYEQDIYLELTRSYAESLKKKAEEF